MAQQARTVLALLPTEARERCSFVAHRKFHYTELQGLTHHDKAEKAAEKILGDVLDQFDAIFGPCETPGDSETVRGGSL